MTKPITGGCLCGAIRYTITAPIAELRACHCRDCQLESGSPFVTDMNVDRHTVRIAGQLTRYTRTGDSGKLTAMLNVLEPFGIREIAQSGRVAIGRGSRSITDRTLRAVPGAQAG